MDTHFGYCQMPPRRVISDPHLLEQMSPLHPINGAKWPHIDITPTRGRYSGVRNQAIGGIMVFVREITPYLATIYILRTPYRLCIWRACDILGNR